MLTQYVGVSVTLLISALNLEGEWRVSIRIGGRRKAQQQNSNAQKSKPTTNIAMINSTAGSPNMDGEFYALITDTNPPDTVRECYLLVITES